MSSWHSYPSIYNFGHRYVTNILSHDLNIEEKIDGSQFSFGVIEGQLRCKSKNKDIDLDNPDKMFNKAVETVKSLQSKLTPEWTYRAEYLQSPKHNTLEYDRTPDNHLIVFDINDCEEGYLSYKDKISHVTKIGLETVPLIYQGTLDSADELFKLMDKVSCLGKVKMEGIVLKPDPPVYGQDKKAVMAKFVSEEFKESHRINWKEQKGPTIGPLMESLRTEARWNKAIQHLRDSGELQNSPADIGKLIKAICDDTITECKEEFSEKLFSMYKKDLGKVITKGFPEWYKEQLVKDSFNA